MEFRFISHTDPLFEKVIELGKKNSSTLGLMPKDAFLDQSRKKCLIVAHENNVLAGYCLFRETPSKMRIGITQVCVSPAFRQKGVAHSLLDAIRDKYKNIFSGMLVSCREDYIEACNLWSKYGFIKMRRVRSRSVDENYLLKLLYSFGTVDLFSQGESTDLRAAIDLNIIIKLMHKLPEHSEVHQLLADWLTDEVDYWYAKENRNEIHRDKDHSRASRTLTFLSSFHEMNCDPSECEKYLPLLKQIHPGNTPNHSSDRRQIAECKVSRIAYFVTMDGQLIDNRDVILEKMGITILRPAEFILEIDELKNRRLYEPLRLQGARFDVKRLESSELSSNVDFFLANNIGERKAEFLSAITTLSADTSNSYIKIIYSPDSDKVGLYGVKSESDSVCIDVLRVRASSISNTLFHQILIEVIRDAVSRSKQRIIVNEQNLSSDQKQILTNNGFYEIDQHWVKVAFSGFFKSTTVVSATDEIMKNQQFFKLTTAISAFEDQDLSTNFKLRLERSLWPAKLLDLELPSYVVPIKPLWASHLFDYLSAEGTLFGSSPELSWGKENVYYKSAYQEFGLFPGRILWYASQEPGFVRQKAIVACSYLNNVIVGEAKQLFSTFHRYGVYEWSDISKMVDGDIHAPIQVLQFSDTEVFKTPIPFEKVNEVLLEENSKRQTFVSRVRITNSIFNKLYKLAQGLS